MLNSFQIWPLGALYPDSWVLLTGWIHTFFEFFLFFFILSNSILFQAHLVLALPQLWNWPLLPRFPGFF